MCELKSLSVKKVQTSFARWITPSFMHIVCKVGTNHFPRVLKQTPGLILSGDTCTDVCEGPAGFCGDSLDLVYRHEFGKQATRINIAIANQGKFLSTHCRAIMASKFRCSAIHSKNLQSFHP